jgi:hypothetical protein
VRAEVAPTKNKTQGDALSAQGPIDHTPGRLVRACPPLILVAIIMRLTAPK